MHSLTRLEVKLKTLQAFHYLNFKVVLLEGTLSTQPLSRGVRQSNSCSEPFTTLTNFQIEIDFLGLEPVLTSFQNKPEITKTSDIKFFSEPPPFGGFRKKTKVGKKFRNFISDGKKIRLRNLFEMI